MAVREEHEFWLRVLFDHAHFVFDHLSPSEQDRANMAAAFIKQFGALRDELASFDEHASETDAIAIGFAKQCRDVAAAYYQFEGHLQRARMQNEVGLSLTPTYLAGTLAENEEYLRILSYFTVGKPAPPLPLTDLLELWLLDQSGHGLLLESVLDPIEVSLLRKVHGCVNVFLIDLASNVMTKHYLRFTPPGFPFQRRLVRRVAQNVIRFYTFVHDTLTLYDNDALMNKTTRRFLEHHFPESKYFLDKLANFDPMITRLPNYPST